MPGELTAATRAGVINWGDVAPNSGLRAPNAAKPRGGTEAQRAGSTWTAPMRASRSRDLALQLQEPAFEVSLLCGGLMSAPPSRPSNDEGWLNAPLRQSDRYAPDFLHRPGNRQAWR